MLTSTPRNGLEHAMERRFSLDRRSMLGTALALAGARWMPRDVVEACDSPEEVPRRMEQLARDPARRRALGDAGRAWAEAQWSWDATVRAYERIYDDVADDSIRS
jgi:glycosyltransferase involved in cell wall biosynthesis